MTNRLRGEISACLDGRKWTLVLTLGALAELETAFACEDLQSLVDRFSSGRLSAGDLIKVIGAGLRGAGNEVSDDQLAQMTSAGGAAGYAAIAADLLQVTFGEGAIPDESDTSNGSDSPPENVSNSHQFHHTGAGENPSAPFPGHA
ncbi:gene transfer agent family protein [Roseibium algae]|uniref:Gene transfer agent family protein n=1 Tax=Roseibium algae TaxID=3123038 RepID=A0ABU8TJP7_9HYPH